MEFLKPILSYWSLTAAVFVFWAFAILVAGLDVVSAAREAAKKKRAEQKPPSKLDPNPLTATSVAETVMRGPGQKLDAKRAWVANLATDIVKNVNPTPPVQVLVLEDSKGHPMVHFSNGTRLETYRIDRTLVENAMKGDAAKINEVADMLRRHLTADFGGREDQRPARTTELTRDTKPAATAPAPAAAAATAAPAQGAPAAPAKDVESMSREERLAVAKAKAEAMRAAAQGGGAKPAAAPSAAAAADTPAGSAEPAAAATPAPAPAAKPADTMTREEKLAAARAKIEEMKKRQGKTE